jgi:5-methylcytosine-specific restriction endonuclease McrA
MKAYLHKSTVLVLNRNWQAIGIKTPAEAFCMLVGGTGTPLDIQGDHAINKVTWAEWIKLPVRPGDQKIGTPRGDIRVPTVIVAANYAHVPMRRPKFTAQGIWERDRGICQYTGQKLRPGEGNIDHVVPKSRGGKNSWENCVLSHKGVNSKKGNKLPQEAGLKLLKEPKKPQAVPATVAIQRWTADQVVKIPDWQKFIA